MKNDRIKKAVRFVGTNLAHIGQLTNFAAMSAGYNLTNLNKSPFRGYNNTKNDNLVKTKKLT